RTVQTIEVRVECPPGKDITHSALPLSTPWATPGRTCGGLLSNGPTYRVVTYFYTIFHSRSTHKDGTTSRVSPAWPAKSNDGEAMATVSSQRFPRFFPE